MTDKSNRHLKASDLRAAAALATQATASLVDLVEAMHERIARLPGIPAPAAAGRTRGITGLVYKTVRGVNKLVGGSAEALLDWLQKALAGDGSAALATPEREAVIAAMNGVLGDHLAATNNLLATPMALRSNRQALVLDRAALASALPQAGPRLLVLAHGLCMNDLQWQRNGHDHGAMLAAEAGWTPVYAHYNSGQHVSTNGAQFAGLMEQLVAQWPVPIERMAIVGHSMGGLLARNAIHTAQGAGMRWWQRLDDLVCLGTPHHGAPLERAGRGLDLLLEATPYSAPLARLGQLRSAGITDLRHGNVLEADWAERDRFPALGAGGDRRVPLPLPEGVRCYALAASLDTGEGTIEQRLKPHWLGDGLVPVDSALGRHVDPARTLAFAPERQAVFQNLGHLGLLSDQRVAAQLLDWLR